MNEWTYHRLIIIEKSKMAESNMAGWSLKRLYLSYSSTQICDALGVMIQ